MTPLAVMVRADQGAEKRKGNDRDSDSSSQNDASKKDGAAGATTEIPTLRVRMTTFRSESDKLEGHDSYP
jgi:hypothetical protein